MWFLRKRKCACCKSYRFDKDARHEICPICGWEQDRVQEEDPDFAGGANKLSLREARAQYKAHKKEAVKQDEPESESPMQQEESQKQEKEEDTDGRD